MNGIRRTYAQAHCHAVATLARIEVLLHDLPAADDEEQSISWDHVGTVNEVAARPTGIAEFLEGREQ